MGDLVFGLVTLGSLVLAAFNLCPVDWLWAALTRLSRLARRSRLSRRARRALRAGWRSPRHAPLFCRRGGGVLARPQPRQRYLQARPSPSFLTKRQRMRIGPLIVWYNPCISGFPMATLQVSDGKTDRLRHTFG